MKSTIELTPVTSSQIHSIGHDPATNTLAVCFPRRGGAPGAVYHYANVDAELFDRFQNAESKGSFFIKEIKPNKEAYPFTRMDDADAEEDKQAA